MSKFPFLRKSPLPAKSGKGTLRINLRQTVAPLLGRWEGVDNKLRFAHIRTKGSRCLLDFGYGNRAGGRAAKLTVRLHSRSGTLSAGKERLPVVYDPSKDELLIGGLGSYKRLKTENNET